jgi:hypothetical protein
MEMIRILKSPTDSYIKLLSKSKQKYILLEDCESGSGKKCINENACLRWLKCSRETIRFLAVSDAFLPVTRQGSVGWSNKGIFMIHFMTITDVPNEFVELDIKIDPDDDDDDDDDYQDVLIRVISTITSYDNCMRESISEIIKKDRVCSGDLPQLHLLLYLPSPLIMNLLNLILINNHDVSARGIA